MVAFRDQILLCFIYHIILKKKLWPQDKGIFLGRVLYSKMDKLTFKPVTLTENKNLEHRQLSIVPSMVK